MKRVGKKMEIKYLDQNITDFVMCNHNLSIDVNFLDLPLDLGSGKRHFIYIVLLSHCWKGQKCEFMAIIHSQVTIYN